MQPLPVDAILPELLTSLRAQPSAVVVAPPGSGKSTRVPPALLDLAPGQVYLLQPRRIAAKSLAKRIAAERGQQLGREVGYRVRFDTVGGRDTRLWVMTEGSLTRQLAEDPYLEGVAAVVLDEFHERSIHTDLAIAYLAELQRTLRPDLRLVVMSATIDPAPVAAFLGGVAGPAAVVRAEGRTFPVTCANKPPLPSLRLDDAVAEAVLDAVRNPECGDVLVFLPGMGEIRNAQRAVQDRFARDGIMREVLALHGSLPPEEQDRALAPSDTPKVVLSTNVAETSVTIPGVRTVIDTGTARVNRFNPATGLDELRLEPISRFSADQRAGRAGRTAPGRCIRLASPLVESQRAQATEPEISRTDLSGTLLILKQWSYADTRRFPWFAPPPAERLAAAEALLLALGATTAEHGPLTTLGQQLATLPTHPRVGRLLLDAAAMGEPRLGAALAAVTGERDVRLQRRDARPAAPAPASADAIDRLELLELAERERFGPHLRDRGIDPQAAREAAKVRDDLLRMIASVRSPGSGVRGPETASKTTAPAGGPNRPESGAARPRTPDPGLRTDADRDTRICRLLLAAFPDRVARRTQGDSNRGAMCGGVAVELETQSAVAASKGHPRPELFLAVACQGLGTGMTASTVVRQAAELTEADLEAVFPNSVTRRERLTWDAARGRVDAQVGWWYRDLAVRMARGAEADPERISVFLADQLAGEALTILQQDEAAWGWVLRLRWLANAAPDLGLTPPDDAALRQVVRDACTGCRTRDEVLAKPKLDGLKAALEWKQQHLVEDWAPSHVQVPTGSRIRLDYSSAVPDVFPVSAELQLGIEPGSAGHQPGIEPRGIPSGTGHSASTVQPILPPVLAVRLQELFGERETPRICGGRIPVLLHLLGPNFRCEQVTRDLASFWANTYPQVRKDLRGHYPKHSWPDDPLTALPVAKGRHREG